MSTQGECDLYTIKLKQKLSELGAYNRQMYKPKEHMLMLTDEISNIYAKQMEKAEEEREIKECNRMRRLLERRILQPNNVAKGECDNQFKYFKDTNVKSEAPQPRCLSPSPVRQTPALDAIYFTSIFLDLSYNPEGRNNILTLAENSVLTYSRVNKYKNPLLQEMNETMSVQKLYHTAEIIVFRTPEGCKGILEVRKQKTREEAEEAARADEEQAQLGTTPSGSEFGAKDLENVTEEIMIQSSEKNLNKEFEQNKDEKVEAEISNEVEQA